MASQAAIAGAGVLGAGALGAGSVGTYYAVYGTSESENVTATATNNQVEDSESEQNTRQEPSTDVRPTGETEASSQLSVDEQGRNNVEGQNGDPAPSISLPLGSSVEDSSKGSSLDLESSASQSRTGDGDSSATGAKDQAEIQSDALNLQPKSLTADPSVAQE
ncbi:hypothetical protein [Candidatus Mycoplasma haematohominis]|uniref:Uncharacterized protein n=1 Tax=Candidatus Mycoplasma haematohominis TaxID=1494318 RepID=A0A478FPF1_9MOLU|nr:hypothetical protein [Candidatus Mycoplasma haemohominis]GCE63092.1 hypothetical protein MHSWG343_00700 [Candidatus Mycoplasma haemohominis]